MEDMSEQVFMKTPGAAQATLEIASGTSDLVLRSTLSGDVLARAELGPRGPVITSDGRTISVRHPWWSWCIPREQRAHSLDLSRDVELSIDVRGGVASLDADLRGGRLAGLTIHGGASGLVLERSRDRLAA